MDIRAFSLLELLIVLAIFSLLLIIVVPNGQGLITRNRALVYANELKRSLQFTRINAIKLGEKVIFCGSKNGEKCDGLWSEGRLVVSVSGKVLRVFPKIFSGDKLIWESSLGKKNVVFLPTGFLDGQQGSFHYCPNGRSQGALKVVLNASGRVRISNRKEIRCGV